MNRAANLALILFLTLAACGGPSLDSESAASPSDQLSVVSGEAMEGVLALVEAQDFHGARRLGEQAFQEGSFILNHREVFEGFPHQGLSEGQISYGLLHLEGDGGVADISLLLEDATGRVIRFNAIDATF